MRHGPCFQNSQSNRKYLHTHLWPHSLYSLHSRDTVLFPFPKTYQVPLTSEPWHLQLRLPRMFFPQIYARLTSILPSDLCSNVTISVRSSLNILYRITTVSHLRTLCLRNSELFPSLIICTYFFCLFTVYLTLNAS